MYCRWIGVVLPLSLRRGEIGRLYSGGSSLPVVVSASPGWWTSKAKAKTVGHIVSDLRKSNILFRLDEMAPVSDFGMNGLRELEGIMGGLRRRRSVAFLEKVSRQMQT
jgi:hypothetical protein